MYAFRLNNFKPERVSCTPVKIIPRKIFIPCVDVLYNMYTNLV